MSKAGVQGAASPPAGARGALASSPFSAAAGGHTRRCNSPGLRGYIVALFIRYVIIALSNDVIAYGKM